MIVNPFLIDTERPLVALKGHRGGYVQLAPSREVTSYKEAPTEVFQAAHAWAAQLELLGARRVYWITLSEVVSHLHIHLYPRWTENELKGLPLFEAREDTVQPVWTPELTAALQEWAEKWQVHVEASE
ncbi:MAG: hypothetical protein KTR14_03835 [Vampirovibrio sp.]|nr:hypothetical protein [Vampirovibrio sp.]